MHIRIMHMQLLNCLLFGLFFVICSSGKTTLSASGMLLPNSFYDPAIANNFFGNTDTQLFRGLLVLTVASVIEPFISLHHRENISQVGGRVQIRYMCNARLTKNVY